MEQAVKLYKEVIKYSETTSASIARVSTPSQMLINTVQSQRDIERAEKIKFSKTYCVDVQDPTSCKVLFRSSPVELNNEIWNKESGSGKYRAVVRKVMDKKQEEKQYIEVWNGSNKIENIDVTSSEKHGKIYDADEYFGCLEWSGKEDKLLFAAEKKYKKAVSYFAKQKEEKPDEIAKGDEYVYREDWGEGLIGKHISLLCVLTIATGEIQVLPIPDNLSAGQAKWLPGDEGIVFTGWYHEPYRLGLIYCPMRKSTVFSLDLKSGNLEKLSVDGLCSRSPVISPDGQSLVFLQNNSGGPHMQCAGLVKYDLNTKVTHTVVEKVKRAPGDTFPGIYSVGLPKRCWSSDNRRIVINTVWRSSDAAVVVNTSTKVLTRLPSDGNTCIRLLLIQGDVMVAECSSPARPNYLVVGILPASGKEDTVTWKRLDEDTLQLQDIAWKLFQHTPTPDRVCQEYPDLTYESVLVYPTKLEDTAKRSLIVFPHGGPHAVFTSSFMLYVSLLCKLGYSSLMVNYRGSSGYGNDGIYCLPGKCGNQDVKDVQSAALEVIQKEGFSQDHVFVWGGSHGGFLTCHLVGQYPKFYKAAVCRNAVIDMATMTGSSDIPDWCFVESGLAFDHTGIPSEKSMTAMWNSSPLQYVDQIETPVMIMIGQDDRRCPPKQSHELYKALKSRNKTVRCLSYPDNGHPIAKVDHEADAFINIFKWFEEHQPSA